MRVYGPNGTALATAPSTARRTAGGTFSVSEQDSPRNAAAAGGLRAISSLDALIALQGVEDATERRKRAVAKGRNALDVLDKLKLALLDGSVDQTTLARLKVAAYGMTELVTHCIHSNPYERYPDMAMGKVSPGYEMLIVKEDGSLAEVGEMGELWIRGIRGVSVCLEYYGNAEATEKFFTDAKDAAGQRQKNALEVFYLAVVLGFRGLYGDEDKRPILTVTYELPETIEDWARHTAMTIQLGRGRPTIGAGAIAIEGAPPLDGPFTLIWAALAGLVLVLLNAMVLLYFKT
jgi:acyl-CoA synthetase (AMP-forming)/AMP-acid ligase II